MKKLEEVKKISKNEKFILEKCRKVISNIDPNADVILFGSRARGDAEPESDYDIIIFTDHEATLKREDTFRCQLYPIELETGAVITVMLETKKVWDSPMHQAMPLYQNIKRDGLFL
jgi:predicted nucleotidyltransferase